MKISIILPSIHPKAMERSLANIHAATTNPVEVLVVSPTQPSLKQREHMTVVWLEEKERRGAAAAQRLASHHATGDMLVGWADDHLFIEGWDSKAIANFLERENRFRSGGGSGPFNLGLRNESPSEVGTVFGMYYAYFPMMRREDALRLGWYTCEYRHGFSDCDMGLRIWASGGRCEFSRDRLMRSHGDALRAVAVKFAEADIRLLVECHGARFARGWNTSELRGFNLDLVPERLPHLVTENSYEFNDARFVHEVALAQYPSIVEAVAGTNIVCYRCRFFTVPQSLGAVDLEKAEDYLRPEIMAHDTLDQARRWISDHPQPGWWHPHRWGSKFRRMFRLSG